MKKLDAPVATFEQLKLVRLLPSSGLARTPTLPLPWTTTPTHSTFADEDVSQADLATELSDDSYLDEDVDDSAWDDLTNWSTKATIADDDVPPDRMFWDEMPEAYPFPSLDDDNEALDEALRQNRQTKNYHRRRSQLDPRYHDDLFLHEAPSERLVSRLKSLTKHSKDPYVDGYINECLAATLADTGATGSFISEGFWRRINGPSDPSFAVGNPGFVTANDKPLHILGRQVCNFTLAGRSIQYPFWIMSSAITDCIIWA